ncbi:MAG: epoxyqueuosine reductase QueH [Clostridiales bacterium]|nr:epoxyqueuosine reductase QueH [Clostridiales bacterium]
MQEKQKEGEFPLNRNYQKELEKIILENEKLGKRPMLLLHVCCAPCSSYCLEYLDRHFELVLDYYNPNISPKEEYDKRVEELKRLLHQMPLSNPVSLETGKYEPELFFEMAKGMEEEPEGGKRCFACYEMRLRQAAREAVRLGCDYFTTTLSISPYKNAGKLNEIGEKLAKEYHIPYLPSDFKKKNGYKRSIELSDTYKLYRQNYCGCPYSRMEAEKKRKNYTESIAK